MRAVIYARYSTDMQRDASLSDQVELCRRYAVAQGWTLVETYTDAARSGADKMRPGFQQMLADARAGRFDVLVCEAIDRLGRNLSDVSAAFDELQFARIAMHTLHHGRVTQMHIGIMGTLAQMTLSDTRDKVRRGLLGRVRAGRMAGGLAYGYDIVPPPPGIIDRGERRINPEEAHIVRRIFTDYANGAAPQRIARSLNAEGIPGPGGRPWIDTTIRGQVDRGTGLLNNTLYIGQLSWNRCSYVKDPRTRKRVARVNPPSEWEHTDVPALRIIDQALWNRVKQRQQAVRTEMPKSAQACSNKLNGTHRRHFLLSGLLICGCCGGGYTIIGKDRYGCATRKGKGTCQNRQSITRQAIEARVLHALRESLLTPAMIAVFVQELEAAMANSRQDILLQQRATQRGLAEVSSKIEGLMQSIERGAWTPKIGERLQMLEQQEATLQHKLQQALQPPPMPALSANAAELYQRKVINLEAALNDPTIRDEAGDALRGLIERIVLTPDPDAVNGLAAMLEGVLAEVLLLASDADTRSGPTSGPGRPGLTGGSGFAGFSVGEDQPGPGFPGGQLSVVAGIGFEPRTFRL